VPVGPLVVGLAPEPEPEPVWMAGATKAALPAALANACCWCWLACALLLPLPGARRDGERAGVPIDEAAGVDVEDAYEEVRADVDVTTEPEPTASEPVLDDGGDAPRSGGEVEAEDAISDSGGDAAEPLLGEKPARQEKKKQLQKERTT
jgi:hypothetical protein